MPAKAIIFIVLFLICTVGAVFLPHIGIYAYVSDYYMGSASQWWAAPFRAMGIRFSLTIAVVTIIGIFLKWKNLKFGRGLLYKQETLIVIFLIFVWFFSIIGEETIGRYSTSDHPTVKLTKIVVFAMMMSHLITDINKLTGLVWVFIFGCLMLGVEAWSTPYSSFSGGRLEGIGGPDFRDSNRFGGFMAGMLFVIGAQFLRSGLIGKLICFLAGGFTANAVILTRSRGAVLAVGAGMFVLLMTVPQKYRFFILSVLIIAGAGIFYLTDTTSLERTATVTATTEERDKSAQSRLDIWAGGYKMFKDNLLGVGPGNFYQNIGRYQPLHPGRDAHNTIIRCIGELGLWGIVLFGWIVLNASLIYYKFIRLYILYQDDMHRDFLWLSLGLLCCLGAMFTYGMTGTLLYTEYLWWMLAVPVCLQRSYDNNVLDTLKNKNLS